SQLVSDPQQQDRKYYLANQGDVFCVANFEAALLDLPVKSPASSAEGLLYEAFTERIPPLGTAVSVILGPGPAAKAGTPLSLSPTRRLRSVLRVPPFCHPASSLAPPRRAAVHWITVAEPWRGPSHATLDPGAPLRPGGGAGRLQRRPAEPA